MSVSPKRLQQVAEKGQEAADVERSTGGASLLRRYDV